MVDLVKRLAHNLVKKYLTFPLGEGVFSYVSMRLKFRDISIMR